jgi:zinc/manganese transport system substrate-binding protein
MQRRLLLASLPLLALPARAQGAMKVVVTFSILGDLVAEVGGDKVEVTALVGPDTDAHHYHAKPTDARVLAGAKVLVTNGLGFEGWIDRLAGAAPFKGRKIVASAGIQTKDPHCWQDVAQVRGYVATIARGLAEADPANAEHYRQRANAYDQRLAGLDAWIKGEIAKVPPDKRKVIIGHDAFGHFARAYGVQFSAARGIHNHAEASARDVAALIRQVREQKIKALFVENMTNPAMIAEIARDSGGVVGPTLYSDALSKSDGPAATYEALMRHNVSALVAGMLKN